MTQMLGSLAGGKVVAMLEVGKAFSLLLTPSSYCIDYSKGGYNVDVISECSLAVTKVLLGDAAPMLPPMVASGLATETVYQVALVQAKYWKSVHPKALDSFEGVQDTDVFPAHFNIYHFLRGDQRYYNYSRYPPLDCRSPPVFKSFV